MNKDEFWMFIEQSIDSADSDCDEQAERLTSILAALPAGELVEFDRHMADRRLEAYRYDLWAVAYIINGGCSDDGFEYFCAWLISRGRRHFEASLAAPERAADGVSPGDNAECEAILYAVDEAYTISTGGEMPRTDITYPSEPAGASWSEDDIEEFFPELWERFL